MYEDFCFYYTYLITPMQKVFYKTTKIDWSEQLAFFEHTNAPTQ